MAVRIVSATGGSGAGTLGDPWSLTYAIAHAGPFDNVFLHDAGGEYSSVTGYDISCDGTAVERITFDAYPGATPVIDGALPAYRVIGNTAWTLHDAATNTYKTVATNLGANKMFANSFIGANEYPLVTYKTLAGLMATTQDYRDDGAYYMGPGILETTIGGQAYCRLEDATPTSMSGRVVEHFANKDPRQNDIRLFTQNTGITVSGDYVTWRGITVNDFYTDLAVTGLKAIVQNHDGRFGYFGINLGASDGALLINCVIDGQLYNDRSWLAWYDVKGGITNADWTRKCGVVVDTATNWRFTEGQIINVFDGLLGGATHDFEIDHSLIQCWDDAWQIYASPYRGNIHDNRVFGAGFGHDSSGSSIINADPATVRIHDNIIDPHQYPVLWGRVGVSGSGEGILGVKDPMAVTAHGQPTTGRWPSPWKYYQNTIIYGDDIAFYGGLDYFGADTAENQYDFPITNDMFNNIFVLNCSLGLWFHSNTGREILDGNVYWYVGTDPNTGLFRLIKNSGVQLDSEAPNGSLNTLAKMKATRAFTDSQMYYLPGWENSGLQVNPQLDPVTYLPGNAACLTLGVDLTGTGWPGTETQKSYRGAVGPAVAPPTSSTGLPRSSRRRLLAA